MQAWMRAQSRAPGPLPTTSSAPSSAGEVLLLGWAFSNAGRCSGQLGETACPPGSPQEPLPDPLLPSLTALPEGTAWRPGEPTKTAIPSAMC